VRRGSYLSRGTGSPVVSPIMPQHTAKRNNEITLEPKRAVDKRSETNKHEISLIFLAKFFSDMTDSHLTPTFADPPYLF